MRPRRAGRPLPACRRRRRAAPRAWLLLAAALPLLPFAAHAGTCSNERPREVFAALEAIDEDGERRLGERLAALSAQEGWSQSEWQRNVLALADDARAGEREQRRDALVAEMFGLLARQPPYDCAELDRLEDAILELERQQWRESIEAVERRLGDGAERDSL